MIIKYGWPKGPWHWVDSYDDQPICPFIDPEREIRYPSQIQLEGNPSLRTVAEDENALPEWIVNAEYWEDDDAIYRGLQAFPLIVDSLIALMKANETIVETNSEIRVAYLNAVAVLVDAGLEITSGEQLTMELQND